MNSITRLILHRVASGNVPLTPQLIEVLKELKEVSEDRIENPTPAPPAPAGPANEARPETPSPAMPTGFLSPTGRWICRASCALLLCASAVGTAVAADSFDTANEAFARGQYAAAARGYEAVIAQQGYSAPVLFNLANAQQRDGQLGGAILNFERAALLAPNDADVAANLNRAREQAGIPTERQSPLQRAARVLTLNLWFGVAAVAVFLIAAARPLQYLRPRARGILNLGSVLGALALALAVGALLLRRTDLHRAVVTAPEAGAGVAPVKLAQPVFKLRAGEMVTVRRQHGAFVRIRNQAGQEGWVQAAEIARIVELPPRFPRS